MINHRLEEIHQQQPIAKGSFINTMRK